MGDTSAIARVRLGATSAFLIRGPAPILVDAGMVGQQSLLRFRLRRLGIDATDLALIVITHAHSDHVGCLGWLRGASDAAIACSQGTMDCLRRGQSACMKPRTVLSRVLLPLLSHVAGYPAVEGDVAVLESMTLAPYGIPGVLLPTPGHTLGCLSAVVGEDAIVGDLVSGRFGQADMPTAPRFLEDSDAWASSVRRLLDLGVRWFHAAHGGSFDAERVAALL